MKPISDQRRSQGPRRRKHYSFDESVNESPQLIEDEVTDIEEAVPRMRMSPSSG